MACCEKCWSDANRRAGFSFGFVTDEYNRLLDERISNPCTPEEQCGHLHIICVKDEHGNRCRCGKERE